MVGILVAIGFAIWFYLTAKRIGKNSIIWALIGLASYYGPVLLYSLILRSILSTIKIRVSSSGSALAYGLGIGLSAVAVGAISAYYIRKRVLLKEVKEIQIGDKDLVISTLNSIPDPMKKVEQSSNEIYSEVNLETVQEELFKALDAAWIWGKENEHPGLENYPQYNQVRKLGETISSLSGFKGMQNALLNVKERARPVEKQRSGSEYLGGYTALAEKAWIGIENWN